MKKIFFTLAVLVMAICANAQKNQYFWYQGNLMMGNPITQIDSVTFGEDEPMDTLHIMLPRTIIKTVEVHDTVYITIHDTVCPNETSEGALNGLFSVAADKQVRFSKGNLWYNAMEGTHMCADGTSQQGTWKFAEHQYDTLGCTQILKSPTYNGWISAFAWGTSGWNSGANKYQPWECSTNDFANYCPGGSSSVDLVGEYAYADWGVYNAIENGGNQPNMWRTLTKDEWSYLLNNREQAAQLKSYCKITGIEGLLLLPDNYVFPEGVPYSASRDPQGIDYSISEWQLLEKNGAVFIAADWEHSLSNGNMGWGILTGNIWTTTHYPQITAAYTIEIKGSYSCDVSNGRWRCDSGIVRLVQDVE